MPEPGGVRVKETLHPILEPFDLKGVGFTYYRYLDPAKQDDTWLYLPSLRRVRRLSTAQRSDALFGQDTDRDSYGGYAGQIAWFEWKFLGEKEVLGVDPRRALPGEVGRRRVDWAFGDAWEKRKVYVVEGDVEAAAVRLLEARPLHRQGELRGSRSPTSTTAPAQLWKVWVNDFTQRKRRSPARS